MFHRQVNDDNAPHKCTQWNNVPLKSCMVKQTAHTEMYDKKECPPEKCMHEVECLLYLFLLCYLDKHVTLGENVHCVSARGNVKSHGQILLVWKWILRNSLIDPWKVGLSWCPQRGVFGLVSYHWRLFVCKPRQRWNSCVLEEGKSKSGIQSHQQLKKWANCGMGKHFGVSALSEWHQWWRWHSVPLTISNVVRDKISDSLKLCILNTCWIKWMLCYVTD